jgi:dipeptidyl aminopeptidase/acylaminoacyl peptidase
MKTIAAYGTWVSPVTRDLVVGQTVGLSPPGSDGDTLYWLESRPTEGGRSVLVRRRPDGHIEDVTPPPFNVASRVHEYGGGAYAVRRGHVVFSNKADGSVWQIAPGGAPAVLTRVAGCRYADFCFLPGGDAVVCVREDHRDRPATDPLAAIVVLPLAAAPGDAGMVLVQGPDFLASPRPSPDGTHLAWIAWEHPDMPWDATRLMLAPLGPGPSLGAMRCVAGATAEALVAPAWSPDGVLHVCTDRSGWWNLYRAQGEDLVAVAPMPAEIGGPAWSFGQRPFAFLPDGGVIAAITHAGQTEAAILAHGEARPVPLGPVGACPAVLADGALAWLAVPPERPAAILLARPGSAPEVLRASGPALLGAADVAVGEAIRFATPDGEEAHAFWYAPANASFAGPPEARPPLVVISHGGPTGMAGCGFSPRIQWWTSRGFAVVDVNYRGSTGFGTAYRERLRGAWGVIDVMDCIAAARHLAAEGRVDPARLAIRGGSAGGFTTLAALTTSDTFRAGASHYGIGDLTLLARDTHKFESRYLDRLIGRLPEDAAVYRARSPINHIDALRCGVIFFQGLDDRVVPPNQAESFVAAMRARGLPVAYYAFADEAHGFRKAETLHRVLDLELDFFGRLFGFEPAGLAERVALLG